MSNKEVPLSPIVIFTIPLASLGRTLPLFTLIPLIYLPSDSALV